MTEDSFEEFIMKNRADFDSERPSLQIWGKIDKALSSSEKRKGRIFWLRSIAAACLLLIGIGLGYMIYPTIQENKALQAFNESEDFSEMRSFFDQEIQTRFTSLENSARIDLEEDLSLIDQNIDRLKLELIRGPKASKEVLMEAIISSFEAKIDILERALNRANPTIEQHYESKISL